MAGSWERKITLLEKELSVAQHLNHEYAKRISLLEEREEILQQSFREITTLHRLSEQINSPHELSQILAILLEVVKEVFLYKVAAIFLWQAPKQYQLALGCKFTKSRAAQLEVQIKQGLLDWALQQRKPVLIPALTNNQVSSKKSYLFSPLITSKENIGVLYLETNADALAITQQHFQMLALLSNQAAIAILNARLYQELLEKTTAATSANNFLESVLGSMSDLIIVFDSAKRLVRINERARQFFSLGKLVIEGKVVFDVLPKTLAEFYAKLVLQAEAQKKTIVKQVDYQGPQQNYSLEVIASPLKDSQGNNRGIITVCRDLTERIALMELKRIDKIKSELIANISHELRTPLTSIKVCGETLLDSLDTPNLELSRNYLEIICEQSDKLNLTISNFIELALLEANERVFTMKQTTASAIVKSVLESSDLGEAKVETYLEDNLPPFLGDEFELTLALVNLLHNGLKYSREKKVRLEVVNRKKGKQRFCCFRVIDWGIGIEEKYLARLSEKLYRIDSSLTAETSGAGIGLAVVRKIVEAHSGKLEIASTPNQGSVFTITLPAMRQEP